MLTWLFFRASSFGDAWTVLQSMLFIPSGGKLSIEPRYAWLLIGLWMLHFASHCGWLSRTHRWLPDPLFAMAYALAWFGALMFLPANYRPFIYFQF